MLSLDLFILGGHDAGEQSSLVTILSVWNTMMGSSVLAMPWAIQQAGFGLGLGLMLFMCTLAYYTCRIILASGEGGRSEFCRPATCSAALARRPRGHRSRCVQSLPFAVHGQEVEFADVCRFYLGARSYYAAAFFSVLSLLGVSMVYWVSTSCAGSRSGP